MWVVSKTQSAHLGSFEKGVAFIVVPTLHLNQNTSIGICFNMCVSHDDELLP